jgi:hypothetical protein
MKRITKKVPRENKAARAAKKTISSLTRYFTFDYLYENVAGQELHVLLDVQ